MELSNRPALRASRPDRDWLLRAHDIKGVVSCLTLIADELRDARHERQTVLGDRVMRACRRLTQLSGLPVDGREGEPPTLPAVLGEIGIFARILAGPRTRIETDAPDMPIRGAAEAAVFRILLNLASNAVRATNASGGGLVRITAEFAGGHVSILVTNEGAGLFAARLASGRRRDGSGLGLVIAEALTRDLGGSLGLRRGRPGTTCLKLILPLSVFSEEA